MQPSICWARRTVHLVSDPGVELLRSVLAAAARTAYYSAGQSVALLEAEDAAASGQPVELVLERFPVVPRAEFLAARSQFWNSAAAPRLFRLDRVATVPNGWRGRLGFPAEALEGTAAALLRLAAAGPLSDRLRRARRLLVNAFPGETLLPEAVRERLWNRFERPVFEQMRGWDGETLAAECDAHRGLHLDDAVGVFELVEGELVATSLRAACYPVLRLGTGLFGELERGRCPCGRQTPRFLPR